MGHPLHLQAGLTADELLLQATRAWNVAVRERPQDEGLWLDFAAFQHTAAAQQQVRGRCAAGVSAQPRHRSCPSTTKSAL